MNGQGEAQGTIRWKMGGFDLDGTLIFGSTVLLHVGRHLGRLAEVTALVDGYESFRLSNREVTVHAARMFAGLTRSELMGFMDDVPRLDDIDDGIATVREKGVRTVIATVSFAFAAEWFCRRFNFDNSFGIPLEFNDHGEATGAVLSHVTEEGKAEFVARESEACGFDLAEVFYVGDSRSDIPTFQSVGCAIALNASQEAKANAFASVESRSLLAALSLVPGLV